MLLFCGCDTTNKLYRFKIFFFFTILQEESYLYGCHWPLETDQMTETKLVRGRIDSEELTSVRIDSVRGRSTAVAKQLIDPMAKEFEFSEMKRLCHAGGGSF